MAGDAESLKGEAEPHRASRRVREVLCLLLPALAAVSSARGALAAPPPDMPTEPEAPRDPPPGLPRDPYAGLAPIEDDPFDTSEAHESTTWFFLSVALGGGTSRLGPIATEGAIEGHAFVLPSFSIGVRGGALGFGEPDGNGASARYVAGLVGYRTRLAGDERRVKGASVTFLHVAGGLGWMGLKGYEKVGGGRLDFDVSRALLTGRVAVIWARGVFATAIGLDVLEVPREGLAVLPTLTFGFVL